MKKIALESILSAFVTVIGSSLFTLLLSIPIAEKGNIRISDIYKTESGTLSRNIEVINYTNDYIDGLVLKIPNTCKIENEKSISSLVITKRENKMIDYNTFSLDMIEPKTSSLITIQVQKDDIISFPNYSSKKFSVTSEKHIESPIWKLIKQVLPSFIVYFILLSIFQFFANKKSNELSEQIEKSEKKRQVEVDKLSEKLDKEEKKIEKTDKDLKEYKKNYYQKTLFIKKQLQDYEKELDFWRNTVRQVLFKGDKKHTQAENLFETVTKQLETYTVKSKQNLDLDEILFVVDELNKQS